MGWVCGGCFGLDSGVLDPGESGGMGMGMVMDAEVVSCIWDGF